jgi:hypothetical protein
MCSKFQYWGSLGHTRQIMFNVVRVWPTVYVMGSPIPLATSSRIQVRIRRTDNLHEPTAAEAAAATERRTGVRRLS